MFGINNQVHENTVNFLYQAATAALPKANAGLKLLKSFYINKSREIARRENLNIPNKIYGSAAMCQKCSVPWGEGVCEVSICSTKPKKWKQANFIAAPLKIGRQKNIKKYAVLTCTICKSRRKQKLVRPVVDEIKPLPPPSQINITSQRPKITTPSNKKLKNNASGKINNKTVSKKMVQRSNKANQNHILQLAKLLSSSTSKPSALSHEDKLKQFLK